MSKRVPLQDVIDVNLNTRQNQPEKKLKQVKIVSPLIKYAKVSQPQERQTIVRRRRLRSTKGPTNDSPKRKRAKMQTVSAADSSGSGVLLPPPMISLELDGVGFCDLSTAHDVYLHTKSLEGRNVLPVGYLSESGSRVNNEMRSTLVNWLVEIHGHLRLEPETLHVAVRLLDTTLHRYRVDIPRLQLCGVAVFWIASKLETAQQLLNLMCYKGSVSALIHMEQHILQILDFQVYVADPVFFLNRLMLYDECGNDAEFRNTCAYCMDSIVHDASIVQVLPSEFASSAVLAARYIDGRTNWPVSLGYATGHWPKPDLLRPLAVKMVKSILQADNGKGEYCGAYKKYSNYRNFMNLSGHEKFSLGRLLQVVELLSPVY